MLAGLMAVAAMGSAAASTYTGPVNLLRMSPSPTAPNTIRFGVLISGSSSCSNSGWYAVELPDSSATAKAWIAALLAAQARGANVTIAGNGVCDAYGIEGIWYIDGQP